jgi:serine/threonine protein kinase
MTENTFPDALRPQVRLHWYVLERVLGQGGFGITYLARDTNLDQPVAIKEYLPVDVATRREDGTVRPRTTEYGERYRGGLERFIREARTLARFDHPNIVRVHSVFEFNDTAYMVMRFEEGETLAALLERRHVLSESELMRVLLPIADGLELVHKAGFIHRDIKPDNILIRADGSSVLLDFGSARQALGHTRTVTILVAPGYAPFEQYYSGVESQGPWTDIYGLGATCYRAIAGRPPLDAIARSKGILGSTKEILLPAHVAGAGRYSENLLRAIDHALEFAEADRPQTLADWKKELLGSPKAAVSAPSSVAAAPARAGMPSSVATRRGPLIWASAGAAAVIVAAAVLPWLASMWRETPRASVERTPEPPRAEKPSNEDPSEALRQRLEAVERQLAEERARREEEQRAASERRAKESERTFTISSPVRAPTEALPGTRPKVAAKPPAPKRPATPLATTEKAQAKPVERAPELPPVGAVEAAKLEPPKPEPKLEPVKHEPPKAEVAKVEPPRQEAPKIEVARVDPLASADQAYAEGRYAEAAALLKPLADSSNGKAQLRLGRMYLEGRGVERNEKEAVRLFRNASNHGENEARIRLGDMYASGRGVPQSNFQAYVWYGVAARQGNPAAKASQERVGAAMQPMEIRQAGKLIESLVASAKNP